MSRGESRRSAYRKIVITTSCLRERRSGNICIGAMTHSTRGLGRRCLQIGSDRDLEIREGLQLEFVTAPKLRISF